MAETDTMETAKRAVRKASDFAMAVLSSIPFCCVLLKLN